MKLSKAEKGTLALGAAMTQAGLIIGFVAAMLPARAGEYMDALLGGLSVAGIIALLGFVPFVVAFIITTALARFK